MTGNKTPAQTKPGRVSARKINKVRSVRATGTRPLLSPKQPVQRPTGDGRSTLSDGRLGTRPTVQTRARFDRK